jgi:hypothetical protein
MQTLRSSHVFLPAANAAARLQRPSLSVKLLEYLAQNFDKLDQWATPHYHQLALTIPFIPVYDCRNATLSEMERLEAQQQDLSEWALQWDVLGSTRIAFWGDWRCCWTQCLLVTPEASTVLTSAKASNWNSRLHLPFPVSIEIVTKNLIRQAAQSVIGLTTLSAAKRVVSSSLRLLQASMRKRDKQAISSVVSMLAGCRFLPMEDGTFVAAHNIDLELSADVSADLRALPEYLSDFRDFLSTLGVPCSNSAPHVMVSASPSARGLLAYIQSEFNLPALADVVFTFPHEGPTSQLFAHKLVLSATSSHFSTMFTGGYAEQAGGHRTVMEMPDWVPSALMLGLLKYLYTDEFPVPKKTTPSLAEVVSLCTLLRLSDLYDLEHLKQCCEVRLSQSADFMADNLCALSTHAYACNAKQLFALCVHHLRLLHSTLVTTVDWKELPEPVKHAVLHADY